MKYLFIGGPKDGEWIETQGRIYVTVAMVMPLSLEPKSFTCPFVPIAEFVYQLRTWGCGTKQFSFYTPEGDMSDEQFIQTLLDGYNPTKP